MYGSREEQGLEPLIRVATFNVALFGQSPTEISQRLRAIDHDDQIQHVLEVLVHANPDIVLINELDYDSSGEAARLLADQLSRSLSDFAPYKAHAFPSNTGMPTGMDLIGTGSLSSPENAQGFGLFPGQYGFALLSRYDVDAVRTFQTFLWRDMPNARLPDAKAGTGLGDYYSDKALAILRLSSKNHVDAHLTVEGIGGLHVLLSHPTPPVFDGPENRNGRRNADEIRFWADYLDDADYIVDDCGGSGGLVAAKKFVILGDLNADPQTGDSVPGAIQQLIKHPRVQDPRPTGAAGSNTARFRRAMRVDYVLPSSGLSVRKSGVVWLSKNDPLARLNTASDHHLVWVDLEMMP